MNKQNSPVKRIHSPFYVGETLYHVFWLDKGPYVALYKVVTVADDAATFVRVKTKRGCTEFYLYYYESHLNSVIGDGEYYEADDNQEIGEVLTGKIIPHTWDEFYHIETGEKDQYGTPHAYYEWFGFIERYMPE